MPGVGSTARAVIVIDEQGVVRHRHDHRLRLDYQTVGELKTDLQSGASVPERRRALALGWARFGCTAGVQLHQLDLHVARTLTRAR